MSENGYKLLPIESIIVEEGRARQDFAGQKELSESIAQHGLINPLVVVPQDGGTYRLVAGERRLRACWMLEKEEVPCTLWDDLSEIQQKEIELEENVKRRDLHWTEKIENIRQIDELKREQARGKGEQWTHQDTSNLSGESRTGVSQQIKFAEELEKRPDLKPEVARLPYRVARKRFNELLEREQLQEQAEKGEVKFEASLMHGKAEEQLQELDPESVDLILTDPPFAYENIEDMRETNRGSVQSYTSTLQDSDNLTKQDVELILAKVLPQMARVLKPSCHFYIFFGFGDIDLIKKYLPEELEIEYPILVWNKDRTTSPFRGYSYASMCEGIVFGYKKPRTKYLAQSCQQLLTYKPVSTQEKLHAFQKPPELLEYLIKQSTKPGETVLDPFAGSGATLVAAKTANRQAIGIELAERNWQIAQSWLMKLDGQTETQDA